MSHCPCCKRHVWCEDYVIEEIGREVLICDSCRCEWYEVRCRKGSGKALTASEELEAALEVFMEEGYSEEEWWYEPGVFPMDWVEAACDTRVIVIKKGKTLLEQMVSDIGKVGKEDD